MAKKTKKRPIRKPLPKREATEADLIRLTRKYNLVDPTISAEQLRKNRLEVHEEMSLYSNQDTIYLWLIHPEKHKFTNNPEMLEVFVPYEPGVIYPGYEPTYSTGDDGLLEGSVNGYKIKDLLVPEGTESTVNIPFNEVYKLYDEGNLYAPDFKNSYEFYYPKLNNFNPKVNESAIPLENGMGEGDLEDLDGIQSSNELLEDTYISPEPVPVTPMPSKPRLPKGHANVSVNLDPNIYAPRIDESVLMDPGSIRIPSDIGLKKKEEPEISSDMESEYEELYPSKTIDRHDRKKVFIPYDLDNPNEKDAYARDQLTKDYKDIGIKVTWEPTFSYEKILNGKTRHDGKLNPVLEQYQDLMYDANFLEDQGAIDQANELRKRVKEIIRYAISTLNPIYLNKSYFMNLNN